MIVIKECGYYDERSGVYIGEEFFLSGLFLNESILSVFVVGGILEWFYVEFGFDMFLFVNREFKLVYRRNFSEGNFVSGSFIEKFVLSDRFENKRRVLLNVECVLVLLEVVGEYFGGDFLLLKDNGFLLVYKYIGSVFVKIELVLMGDMFDRYCEDKCIVFEILVDFFFKIEI